MERGIAELDVDGRNPLEVMADIQFVGHAHAAVGLHRLVGNEPAGITDLRLGAGSEPRDIGVAGVQAETEMLHQRALPHTRETYGQPAVAPPGSGRSSRRAVFSS